MSLLRKFKGWLACISGDHKFGKVFLYRWVNNKPLHMDQHVRRCERCGHEVLATAEERAADGWHVGIKDARYEEAVKQKRGIQTK